MVFCGEIQQPIVVYGELSTGVKAFIEFSCYFYFYQSLYYVLQVVQACGGVLDYVFQGVFQLLVSSKSDLYDIYAPP
jgi:hypothetical protein